MEYELITKTIQIQYIKTKYGEFSVPDLWNLMEDLCGTNYDNSRYIYDNKLVDWLKAEGVITCSSTSGYCKSKNYDSFCKELGWTF